MVELRRNVAKHKLADGGIVSVALGPMSADPGGAPLIDFLLGELAGFTGAGWEQEDDVTMVTLQRQAT